MEPLKVNEIKDIQLEMLDEVDSFCRTNGIKYSLAFGTLLGAIRHKGYIPWDDDMDIVMPLPDMLRFKKEFQSKLLKYCDIDTEPDYEFSFSRITYTPTYSRKGLCVKSYGIFIDLYPVVGLPQTKEEIDDFFSKCKLVCSKRRQFMKWRGRIIKLLPVQTIPGYRKSIQEWVSCVNYSFPYDNSTYKLHAGRTHWDNVFDFDIFEQLIPVMFENHCYLATSKYHDYLSHCYGDYMKYPPEDQRHPYHGGVFYWR